jgi:integrase/recombinase XerD
MNNTLELWREDLKLRGLAPSTITNHIDQVSIFLNFLDGTKIEKAQTEDFKAFLADLRNREYRTSSISRVFSALSTFYDYLQDNGQVQRNPIPAIRKRYLRSYKVGSDRDERRCISVQEASKLVNTILDSRNKAIILLFLKTGMRLNELTALDVSDVDMEEKTITLKKTAKRTNRTLFFDDETAEVLQRWLDIHPTGPLFTSGVGRLKGNTIEKMLEKHSRTIGLADPRIDKSCITPHYFRIFFTTMLLRAGMPRHFVQELRGDVGSDAIDIYTRVDKEELRKSYLACIPQLGV